MSSNLVNRTKRRLNTMDLPPEIMDSIIDVLHDDRLSLAACSLACRPWLNRSRYHLHRSVTHNCDEDPILPPDFYSSPAADFVHELDLTMLPDPSEAFAVVKSSPALKTPRDKRIQESTRNIWRTILRLSQVRKLTLRRFECWRAKPAQIAMFSGAFAKVTELHLVGGFFICRSHFSSFVSLFPHLTQLHITDVHWPDSTAPQDQTIVPWRGSGLRQLSLESFPGFDPHVVRDLAAWISTISSKALHDFRLSWSSGRDGTEQLPDIFGVCGPSLKHLILHLGYEAELLQASEYGSIRRYQDRSTHLIAFTESTNIHLLSELESIRFRALCLPPVHQFCDGDYTYVPFVLSQMTSTNMSVIEFECASYHLDDLAKRLDLQAIDSALSRPPFEDLKEVVFIFLSRHKSFWGELDCVIKQHLPKTYARGLIKLGFEYVPLSLPSLLHLTLLALEGLFLVYQIRCVVGFGDTIRERTSFSSLEYVGGYMYYRSNIIWAFVVFWTTKLRL